MKPSAVLPALHPARALLVALALHFALFRASFALELLAHPTTEVLNLVGHAPRRAVLLVFRPLPRDFLVAVALWSVVALAALAGRRFGRGARRLGELALVAVLAAVGISGAAHVRMMVELRSGLDLPALFEVGVAMAGDVGDFVSWRDWALGLSAPVAYLLLRADRKRAWLWSSFAVGAVLALLAAAGPFVERRAVSPFLFDHPAIALARQAVLRPDLGLSSLPPLRVAPRGLPGFVDPALAAPEAEVGAGASLCDGTPRPSSLMLVVVESIAAKHLRPDATRFGAPTPFLLELAARSWWLTEHRTSANSSAPAAFSLFTGLAGVPEIGLSVASSRLSVPAMWSRIGIDERFLVTPAILDGYFPLGLVRRDGLTEIATYDELQHMARRPGPAAALNELDGVDALVRRLGATAGRPFFGVYWSYAPHGPYFDSDPTNPFVANPTDAPERHLRTLRIFDDQLRRIVATLRDVGHGDDTLLVVVADHGQAFGEHGAWAHGRSSWEEVLHVPALIWHPASVRPRADHRVTTHADLLPTILDLLGIPFDPLEFQGESLCRTPLRRRYAWAVGREGVLVSYDTATRDKLVWSHVTGECRFYRLSEDADERSARACSERPDQLAAMKRLFVWQRGLLGSYLGGRGPRGRRLRRGGPATPRAPAGASPLRRSRRSPA